MRLVHTLSPFAALLALIVVAYLPVWHNDFIDFDDPGYLTMNPDVKEGFTSSSFRWIWTIERAPYRMPLTWLSFQFDAHFFSGKSPTNETILSPAAVHGQNLFWHAAGVCLLFGIWRQITGRADYSFIVAALFAVHPMHVESVAWAAERKDVLSGFFGLLAVEAYILYLKKPSWLRYLDVMATFLLSLASKPMLMTLPILLLLLDFWPLRRMRGKPSSSGVERTWPSQARLSGLILEKMPLFVLSAAIGVLTLESHSERGSLVSLDNLSFSARLANAFTAYGWYLFHTFFPWRLAVLYPHPYEQWTIGPTLAGAATMLFVSACVWWQAARRPWLLVGWVWFVVALLPVIGLAQGGRQAWADRFCYWPHIGLFVAIVWGLGEIVERLRIPIVISRLAVSSVFALFSFLTWNQVGTWRDTPTLWQRALLVTANNDQAHEHLARYYTKQGRHKEALEHLYEATRIQKQRNRGSQPTPNVRSQ